MQLSDIRINPANPRTIKDAQFKKLCRSIEAFPEMLAVRPIVVDEDNLILGGNMRYQALRHLGRKTIPDDWVRRIEGLTEARKREFIAKDNASSGEWNWDILANEWEATQLDDWGITDFRFSDAEEFAPAIEPVIDTSPVTRQEIERRAQELADQMVRAETHAKVTCPECGNEFEVDL